MADQEKSLTKREDDKIEKTLKAEVPATIRTKVVGLADQAGTIKFTKAQRDTLFSPIDEEIIEIRPDGLIYLPWMEYVSRLRDAFNGTWAIIPVSEKPDLNPSQNSLMWGFYLFIDGKPYGYAIGEQTYHENNPVMTWGDACEGAKSNALMRLCKGLGIGLELWRPSFIEKWKKKYAESYTTKNKYGKMVTLWRKKGQKPQTKEEKTYVDFVEGNVEEESKTETKKPKSSSDNKIPNEQAGLPEEPVSVMDKRSLAPQGLKMDITNYMNTLVDKYRVQPDDILERMDAKVGHHNVSEFTIEQAEIVKEHLEWAIDKLEVKRIKEEQQQKRQ